MPKLHCRRQHNCTKDNMIDGHRARGEEKNGKTGLLISVLARHTYEEGTNAHERGRERRIRGSTRTCRSERERDIYMHIYVHIHVYTCMYVRTSSICIIHECLCIKAIHHSSTT